MENLALLGATLYDKQQFINKTHQLITILFFEQQQSFTRDLVL